MLLGDRSFFRREHYEAQKGTAPAHLCELVVHCLELVAQLAATELQFRFKGGNSLLLLLQEPQRFSIDVDIVSTASKDEMIDLVGKITSDCDVFTRFEARAPKTKPWLPMISFKLFFESAYQKPEDAFVMLDAVLEPPPYGGVEREVRCLDVYESAQRVEVPSVSGLIGDKLLTIGPSTLGIPLGKNKEAQRLKHVFDVSRLSREPWDAAEVRASIAGCMAQENRIQQRQCSYEEVVVDTLKFLSEPLAHEHKPALESVKEGTYLFEIVKGVDPFASHLFRRAYGWRDLHDDFERVADLLKSIGNV